MPGTKDKRYFIFQEGPDVMFVMNIAPEKLDDTMIRSFLHEVHVRGLDSIIDPNVWTLIKNAKQGEVIRIGGVKSVDQDTLEAERPERPDIDLENLPFTIEISPDGMEAFLEAGNVSAGISRDQIDAALNRDGICHGLIEENMQMILREWPKVFRVLVAQGIPPENGTDAQLRMVKQYKDSLAPKITEEGHVDFKRLDLIEPIEAGEVLQVRVPPTEGRPGYDVFGKVIKPEPGADVRLSKGANTTVSNDGTKLLSSVGGFLEIKSNGLITVRPVYMVNGDVAYSTGIIEYKGDVVVKGDVRSGFAVIAGGDVQIRGAVEDAEVIAGGNVIINGGINSSGVAHVKAGGDVKVGFVKHGNIVAGGSVYIKIESIGSRIHAGGDVEVTRPDGRIIGGEITLGGWMTVPVLGSHKGPPLLLRFEGDPKSRDIDVRFAYCFVSTRSLASPLDVRFGPLMTKLYPIDTPLTISVKDRKVLIQNSYQTQRDLIIKRRKRARDKQAAAEGSPGEKEQVDAH
jgi:hypothetical protein